MAKTPRQKLQMASGMGAGVALLTRVEKAFLEMGLPPDMIIDACTSERDMVNEAWDLALSTFEEEFRPYVDAEYWHRRQDELEPVLTSMCLNGRNVDIYCVPWESGMRHVEDVSEAMAYFDLTPLDAKTFADLKDDLYRPTMPGTLAPGVFDEDGVVPILEVESGQRRISADTVFDGEIYFLGYRDASADQLLTDSTWLVPVGDKFPQRMMEMSVHDASSPGSPGVARLDHLADWNVATKKCLTAFHASLTVETWPFADGVLYAEDFSVGETGLCSLYRKEGRLLLGVGDRVADTVASSKYWLLSREVDVPVTYPINVDGKLLRVCIVHKDEGPPHDSDGYRYTPARDEHVAAFFAQHMSFITAHIKKMIFGAEHIGFGDGRGPLTICTEEAGGEDKLSIFFADTFIYERMKHALYLVEEISGKVEQVEDEADQGSLSEEERVIYAPDQWYQVKLADRVVEIGILETDEMPAKHVLSVVQFDEHLPKGVTKVRNKGVMTSFELQHGEFWEGRLGGRGRLDSIIVIREMSSQSSLGALA